MKLQSLKSPKIWAAACGVALVFSVATHAKGDGWDKKTVLTVNQPIQITDTYLDPGTYVLRLNDVGQGSSRHIVQIFNADQTHIINQVMAIPNYRLQPTGDSKFAFWETPPGTAQALRAWFYPGDNFGQEFRYPSHLRQLAVNTPAPPLAPPPAPVVTETQTSPAASQPVTVEPVAPQPQVEVAQATPAPAQEPVEVAQNTPPPAPANPPQELPKTATPYPLIGLAGLLFLAGYGVIRPTPARSNESA